MIGLLAQNSVSLDQFVLLLKQSLFSGESLSQLDFRAPTSVQLTFAAFNCAALLAGRYPDCASAWGQDADRRVKGSIII
jgi:hypothetical protein